MTPSSQTTSSSASSPIPSSTTPERAAAPAAGTHQPDPYLLFWEWEPGPTIPPSLACFSQWFARDFPDPKNKNVIYKTAEHYMMYHKALLFDPDLAGSILAAPTPAEAKRLGRQVRGFDRAKWGEVADAIVQRGNYLKFSQHGDMRGWLVDTGSKVLVECNPDDRVWGIGFSVEDAPGRESEWDANRMGLALTRAREQIKKELEEAAPIRGDQ